MAGYEGLWQFTSTKAGGKNALTREQFEQIGADIMNGGGDGWAAAVRPHITAMVQLCDTNGDGHLSVDELCTAVRAYDEGTLDVALLG